MQISIKGSGDAQSVEFSGVIDLVSGQTGVAGGAGSVGANTQRVTLGSDDPAVIALQLLDDAIAGNEMQVDVITLPALPAGANTIGNINVRIGGGVTPTVGAGAVDSGTQRIILATQTTAHTPAESSVAATAISGEILAANGSRTGVAIRNDSTVAMYISKGGTASTSSVVKIEPQALYELPLLANNEVYRGAINAIWESATGYARIEEYV